MKITKTQAAMLLDRLNMPENIAEVYSGAFENNAVLIDAAETVAAQVRAGELNLAALDSAQRLALREACEGSTALACFAYVDARKHSAAVRVAQNLESKFAAAGFNVHFPRD